MCPVNFEQAYKEALASAPDNIATLDTITISHSTFAQPFRFVRAEEDQTLDGDLYIARQFDIKLPEMSAASSGGLQLQISDIDYSVVAAADKAVNTLEPMLVLYQGFMTTEVGAQVAFTTPLEGTSLQLKGTTLTINATYPDLVNKKIPNDKYTTEEFPGLR